MRIILSMAAATAVAGATGCGGADDVAAGAGGQVVAAFYPLAYAAEEIGGPGLEVENLTPPGAEPHDLEVSPRDVQRIRSADLVLLVGHDFQPQLEQAAGEREQVVRLLDTPGLELLPNGDPHVWLDPLRYARIAERIGAELGRPEKAEALVVRLHALDDEFRRGLADCDRREIVTSHEAFGYLAERYGLRQIAITGLSPEAEPTPKDLRRVVALFRRTGATTVFFETLVSPRIAETVAREAGARTAVLNPIEGLTTEEGRRGEDYFSIMRTNLDTLRQALGCR